MQNILKLTHLATNIPVEIELDLVEMTWAKDKNPKTINESWDKLCESVKVRTGHDIPGNFQLNTLGGNPCH
jgi:hypothetical protein